MMSYRRHSVNPLLTAAAAAALCALVAFTVGLPRPLAAQDGRAPKPPSGQAHSSQLEKLLNEAAVRTIEYTNIFKDLMAEERQTIDLYNANGQLMQRRRIISEFVVYQSRLDPTAMVEYRNVREVDGVAVAGQQERALNLAQRLVKVDSVSQELDRIDREASRYNLNYNVKGYTLQHGTVVQKHLREAFRFEEAGREMIEGREAIIINYQQISPHPKIKINLSLPKAKSSAPLYRGRIWLDAQTAQLWREEREIIVRLPKFKDPVAVIRFEFHYTQSKFKILVPQGITFSTLGSIKRVEGREPILSPGGRVRFEYGQFEIFDVTVKPDGLTPQQPK